MICWCCCCCAKVSFGSVLIIHKLFCTHRFSCGTCISDVRTHTHYTSMNESPYFMNTSVCSHLGHRTQFNLDFNIFFLLFFKLNSCATVCAFGREHMRETRYLFSHQNSSILSFTHSHLLVDTFHFFYPF